MLRVLLALPLTILADVIPDVSKFITDPPTALLVIIILSGIVALGKGWVVPKSVYDREVGRADRADATNVSMIASQKDVTAALKDLNAEVLRLKR